MARAGAQTGRRGGAGPAGGSLGGKDPTGRVHFDPITGRSPSLLELHGLLQPLLVVRSLLPALVGRTGADQVHVGPQVLLVLPGPIPGTVGPQAEVLGSLLSGQRIANLIANSAQG